LLGYYRHALPGLAFIKTIESGEMSWFSNVKKNFFLFLKFFWQNWILNSGPTHSLGRHSYHLSQIHQPFFVIFFGDRVYLPGAGFKPKILLISASWIARITGVSH
jgi:hypothetical protein